MSREQSAIIKGLAILLMLARPAHFIEITGEVDNVNSSLKNRYMAKRLCCAAKEFIGNLSN